MRKTLLVFFTITCCAFLRLSAHEHWRQLILDKPVTLHMTDRPLKEALDKVSFSSSVPIIYGDEQELHQIVSIDVRERPLGEVLASLLAPFPLSYRAIDDRVVISYRDTVRTQAGKLLNGNVLDEQGKPLPGATIKLKQTNRGVIADKNGNFIIAELPEKGVLIISFIGYESLSIPYNKDTKGPLNIQLKPDANSLNEVQVIGYGTTTKRFNTGSVSTVTAADIEKQPVDNPLAALQGRAPGVLVQTDNGLPGGNISIVIRGQGSIASGTDPLYIIDGIPFLSSPIGTVTGANGAISPFSIINPGDIESISILKDADATSIYGSRAANGVILITTKKGASGKDNFTINFDEGINRISRSFSYLNLQQYLKERNDAFKNDGLVPSADSNSPNYAPDLKVWDTTKSTNWQKLFFGGTARTTNLQTSLSGGDVNTHYLLSLNYHDEGTILPGDEDYKRGGGYLDVEHSSTNKKVTTSFTVGYTRDDNHTLYSSFGQAFGEFAPDFPIYNPDGSYNWSLFYNPIASLQQRQNSQASNLNVNTLIKYNFFKGFDAKLSAGYNNYTLNTTATVPSTSQDPAFSPMDVAYFDNNTSESYILEPQLDYTGHFGNGILTALLGGTYQSRITQGANLEGDGVSNPGLLGVLSAATTLNGAGNSYADYKYESLFGRINYNWQQKYLVDINLRRDGSSRFGPGKQFGNFYAVGGAWIFSEEDFIKNNLPVLSFGKLRSSYGLTGNDQIGDYQYISTYSTTNNYGGVSGLTPSRIANPDYSWETTKKFEMALELGFLKDRILFTSAWYKSTSGNQLLPYTIPTITGFSSYIANFPAVVRNTGLELELNTQPIKGTGFNWNLAFNITIPKNKLVSFPGLAASSYANSLVIGQDLSIIKDLKFTGVDPKTGLAQYAQPTGDYYADEVVAGKTSPDLFGGFSNTFSYKGVQLDVFFEFVKRSNQRMLPSLGTAILNDPAYVVNRWEKPGDISNIPGASTNYDNFQSSTADITDASYIRLKNLALSYNFKSTLVRKWGFKEFKIFVKGENLFVIANDQRFDPEIDGGSLGIPPLRTLTAGVKLTF